MKHHLRRLRGIAKRWRAISASMEGMRNAGYSGDSWTRFTAEVARQQEVIEILSRHSVFVAVLILLAADYVDLACRFMERMRRAASAIGW